MISLCILEMGIISTIAALLVISNKRSGFVGLPDPPRFLLGHPFITKAILNGALFSTIPTFLMNGYNILIRDATLNAVLDRQPFVELAKGGTPEVTIMLEYSKVHLLKRWFKALRNGHLLIAAC